MSLVVLGAYRAALAVGWPGERRWLAALTHASLGLGVAFVSRPVFALAMDLTLAVHVDWPRVFLPPSRGVKLWASMGMALGSSRGPGIGLRNTSTRLSACYGGRARLQAESPRAGEFVASIAVRRSGDDRTTPMPAPGSA